MANLIPGEVLVDTISIFTNKGVLNMTEHVQAMIVQESIIAPGVVAELTVHDSMNILSTLPILGTERIVIEFTAPGRKTAKYDMRISSVKRSEPNSNMRTRGYKILAVSPEMLTNKAIRVSKAYNTNVSTIVSDVIKNYLKTKKTVKVQDTKGIQKIIIPDVRPFEAIKLLRKRATSVADKSSSYVFFENQEGLHFRTIEDLMKSGSVGDRKFINDPTRNNDFTAPLYRNILYYELPQQFDVGVRLDNGGITKEIQKFDYKTLKYEKTISKFAPKDYKSADGEMKDPDYWLMQRNYGNSAGSSKWVAHDSGSPDTFIYEGSGGHASGTSIFKQGILLLSVFGDSELTAGQLIEANVVETASTTTAPEPHSQHSGNYIIASICHVIGPSGDNPRYTCAMECIKGGYKEVKE